MRSRLATAFLSGLIYVLLVAAPANAAFPGGNGKIAFERYDNGNNDIYSMNPDGTDLTRLTTDPAIDQEPAWSPDGRKIVFARYHDDVRDVYVMDSDGSGQSRITDGSTVNSTPSWSPDGRKIVFTSDRDDPSAQTCFGHGSCKFDVYTMNADGSAVTRLTHHLGDLFNPLWSPDGSTIAFNELTIGVNPDGTERFTYTIRTIAPDGSNERSILSGSTGVALGDWSPDSKKLVVSSGAVFTIDAADGGNPTVLASCFENVFCGADIGLLENPVFSPDGTKVAFTQRDCYFLRGFPCSNYFLKTVNSDGTGVTPIADRAGYPDWQPIPGPQRSDYKNAAQFCKAERDFLGAAAFQQKYGGRANAYGKCVSGK
jgi:Tol biopolymer transport system component